MKYRAICMLLIAFFSCSKKENNTTSTAAIGAIERIDPAFDAIGKADAQIEVLVDGFEWSEGPLWIEDQKALLISDVPTNIVYKWTEENGKETYLTPSGRTGSLPYGDEPGSNGLILSNDGKLVLCQHGDRRVAGGAQRLQHAHPIDDARRAADADADALGASRCHPILQLAGDVARLGRMRPAPEAGTSAKLSSAELSSSG